MSFSSSLLLGLAAAGSSWGQVIPNPSFEANSFSTFPGYVAGNAEIEGWTGSPGTNYGLNPAGTSPFADNGTLPNGLNVAFLQSQGSGTPTEMRTTITGLAANTKYRINFRTNARAGQAPLLIVSVDGTVLLQAVVNSVGGAGAAGPWKYAYVDFTAAGATAELVLQNNAAGDTTVLVDDFTIVPAPATAASWSVEPWLEDSTAGVDANFQHTHAYNLNSGVTPVINGIPFVGVPGVNPAVTGKFAVAGLNAGFPADDDNNLAGESLVLGNDFIYNGNPGTLTLQGLAPSSPYVLNLFSTGWEGVGGRYVTFADGDSRFLMDQDAFDLNNGIRITHRYTSTAEGTAQISFQGLAGTFHLYGFSNRSTTAGNWAPVFLTNPAGGRRITGNSITLTAVAAGTPQPSWQWLRNGVAISDSATFSGTNTNSLIITPSGGSEAGLYTLRATNSAGATTSSGAYVEVLEPVPGPLYSTGVDASGVPLAGGEPDPHYTLVQNAAGDSNIPAVVQTGIPGAWLANDMASQWIGAVDNTSTGPAGTYSFRTLVDAGANPDTFTASGMWSVDNTGTAIRVNGVAVTGLTMSTGFNAYQDFTISKANAPSLKAGINEVDFVVENLPPAGPTGLRVASLRVPAGISPVIVGQPQGSTVVSGQPVTLQSRAYGSGALTYQWTFNGTNIAGATGSSYTIPAFGVANVGNYAVTVTNSLGSATSAVAALGISNVPPTVATPPVGGIAAVGESFTFSVTPSGSGPFTYLWSRDGTPVPGGTTQTLSLNQLTEADAGNYTVLITNNFGNATSTAAGLEIQPARVPGPGSTGVDAAGVLLPDEAVDPRWTLVVNADPNGTNGDPAIVHLSTIFPINDGTWLFNSPTSKWISSRANSSGAGGLPYDGGEGGGIYVYQTTFNLTGFNPESVLIAGAWTSDNGGRAIRVNGVDTGITGDGNFGRLSFFRIDDTNADFVNGLNTLEFVVENADADLGYTGLRVDKLGVFASTAPIVALPPVGIRLSGAGKPVISFIGISGTQYRIQRSQTLTPAANWIDVAQPVAPVGGLVEFEDAGAPAGRAFYRVVVPAG